MRKTLGSVAVAVGLTALAATPAFADTVTRTIMAHGYTLTCVITYTEVNGDGRMQTEEIELGDVDDTYGVTFDSQLNAYLTIATERGQEPGIVKLGRRGFNAVGAPLYHWAGAKRVDGTEAGVRPAVVGGKAHRHPPVRDGPRGIVVVEGGDLAGRGVDVVHAVGRRVPGDAVGDGDPIEHPVHAAVRVQAVEATSARFLGDRHRPRHFRRVIR